jgi:hypothetical protein
VFGFFTAECHNISCLLEISKLLICQATDMGILRLPGGRSLDFFGLESLLIPGGFSSPAGEPGDGSKFWGDFSPSQGIWQVCMLGASCLPLHRITLEVSQVFP